MFRLSRLMQLLTSGGSSEPRSTKLSIYEGNFDAEWYSEQLRSNGGMEKLIGESYLEHYVRVGWKASISPNSHFDPAWYLEKYLDVARAGIEPFRHFLEHGQAEGRCGAPMASNEQFLWTATPQSLDQIQDSQALSKHPLVSIIITNKDGRHHLDDLFDSLDRQTYKKNEVIFFDDGSSDDSVEFAASKGAIVLTKPQSIGFASGNNIAYEHARGELIALINNDMRLDSNFIEASVRALARDPSLGAVSPKMRFWSSFQRVRLLCAHSFSFNLDSLLCSLNYRKYFIRTGTQTRASVEAVETEAGFEIALDLPIQEQAVRFELSSDLAKTIQISTPGLRETISLVSGWIKRDFRFGKNQIQEAFYIINNAGGVDFSALDPIDRGFGEVDEGQYDEPCEVDYFCGGAVMIRRDSLGSDKLFIDDFVAYYEDSELSKRIVNKGFRIKYEPAAIVYHKHSASNVELSSFWRKQTFRNKILFQYIFIPEVERPKILEKMRLEVNHLVNWYGSNQDLSLSEKEFAESLPQVREEIEQITKKIDQDLLIQRVGIRIGIYNSFWNTRGGGEAHALDIAELLGAYGSVELISEEDFEIDLLLSFFNKPSMQCRKRIVKEMNERITAQYDIFVNARYQSQLPSRAKHSFFIVSFPSKDAPPEFLDSYRFLFNSHYTRSWATTYWGDSHKGTVVFPRVADEFDLSKKPAPKKKMKQILSVGRFTSGGHIKNQLEIVSAFKLLVDRDPKLLEGWELILVGSSNSNSYLEAVRKEAFGFPVRICVDADFNEVVSVYETAAVYVHASGFCRDPLAEPEKFEHFGMAVAQAAASGCYPIVYAAAGPLEIVSMLGFGKSFNTLSELVQMMKAAVEDFDIHSHQSECLNRSRAAQIFGSSAQGKLLAHHLDELSS